MLYTAAQPVMKIPMFQNVSVSPTYGNQEGSAYNGYFECTCYHPLSCFNQLGALERAMLRNGNVHSADDRQSVLEPIIERYREYDILKFFCGDAAFADPNVYSCLEDEGYFYTNELKVHAILHDKIEHLLTRPVSRPPKQPIVIYESFQYQAASWDKARRVVAKTEWHVGELFPRVGLNVTNLRWKSSNVVKFYNRRGTAEQWIKEGKYALNRTRLSYASVICFGLRARQFSETFGLAKDSKGLVAENTQREAAQDWSKSGKAFELRHIPDGGGGSAEGSVL